MTKPTTKSTKSLLKSVPTSPSVEGDQQETIPLEKIFEAKATCYSREFREYACDGHLSLEYVFQDFKKFFKD